MTILTKYHGNIDVKEEEILLFEQGVPGFLEEKQFILLPLPENTLFHILQSVKTPELGFVVTDPFIFFKDYDFTLEDSTVELLGSPSETEIKVLSIVTVKEPLHESTANLQAPIVINLAGNKAKQLILNDPNYQTRHMIFAQPEHAGKKG
ncbi:flagellar assembly protein FliW [Bacillus sp. es.034]|uniref:flagellar assembly protein FliW n=1 Tax=Bacillus sp. es.034 TaxID=1761763 RepID=UPI000BF90C1B|nr:flagellar assembly protein FliW [Bacillus sp. es.034]PFG04666.1 flagellar assembly factor FliW [Bacillus sp. es.034]